MTKASLFLRYIMQMRLACSGVLFPRTPKFDVVRINLRGKNPARKDCQVLVGCNATGMHRLKLAVVGKSKNPRAFRGINIEQSLPVVYYSSKKAWFNQAIFTDWFLSHFLPEVRKYQEEVLKIDPDDVRVVLVLDNAPAHPSEEKLVSHDGKIKVLYLPPNTTSVIQPMDQGNNMCHEEALRTPLPEWGLDGYRGCSTEVDIRGEYTLANIKNYNIRSAIYNFAAAPRS